MDRRHSRSVTWELARWWVYAAALTPVVLPIVLVAGGHVTAAMLVCGVGIMTVVAVIRRSR